MKRLLNMLAHKSLTQQCLLDQISKWHWKMQILNTDGFQTGTAAAVATVNTVHWYFGFKTGTNFKVGTYSGTGVAHTISGFGLQPDNVWVKQTGATRGVLRTKDMATDSAMPFINVAVVTGDVTAIAADGITVGVAADTNTSGASNYRYVAWKTTAATTTPSYATQTGYYMGNGNAKSISGLGFSPDLVIIKSDTTATATIFKTTPMPENTVAFLGSAAVDSTGAPLVGSCVYHVEGTTPPARLWTLTATDANGSRAQVWVDSRGITRLTADQA